MDVGAAQALLQFLDRGETGKGNIAVLRGERPLQFVGAVTAHGKAEMHLGGVAQRPRQGEERFEIVRFAEIARIQDTDPRRAEEFAARVRVAGERTTRLDQRPGGQFALNGAVSIAAQARAHAHAQVGDQVERAVGAPHHGLRQAYRQGALGQQATGERGLGMQVEAPVRQFGPGGEKSQHNRRRGGKDRVGSHNDQLGPPAPGAQGQPAPGRDHPQ